MKKPPLVLVLVLVLVLEEKWQRGGMARDEG